MYNPALNCYTQ